MPLFPPSTRILIVDDAASMRLTLKAHLNGFGFQDVIEANNGNTAWTLLDQAQPPVGLILSDHNMPECTGLEFLKRVRADARFQKTPFLLVTSEGEKQMIVSAIQAGVSNYVTKPVDAETLRKKLETTAEKFGIKS